MTAQDIKNMLDNYNRCKTERSFVMGQSMAYDNEYIAVVRLDSSNKHTGMGTMGKMWSIIFDQKKSFLSLPGYRALRGVIDIRVTPVTRGSIKGYYGLRIYGMKRDPDVAIVKIILDFIFE